MDFEKLLDQAGPDYVYTTTAPGTTDVTSVQAAVDQAKALLRRTGPAPDTLVCTEVVYRRMVDFFPPGDEPPARYRGWDSLYGMVVHRAETAAEAKALARELTKDGKRVLLVVE